MSFIDAFEEKLPAGYLNNPQYRISYYLVPKISNHKTSADIAVEFVKADTTQAIQINKFLIKETEKEKYKPGSIVEMMKKEGHITFNMYHFVKLWKTKKAKDSSQYGTGLSDGQWYWYSSWIDVVRNYCMEHKF
jgi:hypothetical protein